MTDSRDGQVYKTITIGTQTWMAENLNYETSGSVCLDDEPTNCSIYGRLYTWEDAMDGNGTWSTNNVGCHQVCDPVYPVRGVCPEGWHLPEKSEWAVLFSEVGGDSVAGERLKATSGWDNPGNDDYGFSILRAGGLERVFVAYYARFRTSTSGFETLKFEDYGNSIAYWSQSGPYDYYSVRCIKGERLGDGFIDPRDGQFYRTVTIGDQTWMADNLNYDMDNSFCYRDEPKCTRRSGRLYTWMAATKACPAKWHLPTVDEWRALIDETEATFSGRKLISRDDDGLDYYGFSAFLVGCRYNNSYTKYSGSTMFWSSDEYEDEGYYLYLNNSKDNDIGIISNSKDLGFSVRCVKD